MKGARDRSSAYFRLFPQKCLPETVGSHRIDELGIASRRVTFTLEHRTVN